MFQCDVGVVGGGGHVGLPLAMAFANAGLQTIIYDINKATVETIRKGIMPFMEEGAEELLPKVIRSGRLQVYDTPERLHECKFLVLIIGTPVDEHLNPQFTGIYRAVEGISQCLREGQILILRSTVFPGITEHLQRSLNEKGYRVSVSFCPERVAEGHSLREICELPQIISAFDRKTLAEVRGLFGRLNGELIEMEPIEAELTKLMTNAWRYIQFAVANQFYMIAARNGLDFDRILHACRYKYPRMAGVPGPGFAAGPCLVKDTMQLAAFSLNSFFLGHAALMVNEGLPLHLVEMAKQKSDLSKMVAGILGMAFKAECDDPRDSLSYKLKKILSLECRQVLCTDPFVKDPNLVPLDAVLTEADIIFVGAPHKAYRSLTLPPGKKVFDVWSCLRKTPEGGSRE